MKKIGCCILFLSFVLVSCTVSAEVTPRRTTFAEQTAQGTWEVSYLSGSEDGFLKGIWLSQFDLHPILRDGSGQRNREEFCLLAKKVFSNISELGFDTVFLQVRPNGDSFFESELYPVSKYVAGTLGGETSYDPVEILLCAAWEAGLSVHAWINPLRLSTPQEASAVADGFFPYDCYKNKSGAVKLCGDFLYFDPSYEEAVAHICKGADEILKKYAFDGLHIDDYFYPTETELEDESEFLQSGYQNKGDWRRHNIDRLVSSLFEVAHKNGVVFGVSPAGNLYSLSDGWYADVKKWASEEGFADYLIPQLYFGFLNAYCPFRQILKDWESIVTSPSVKLYVGISAAKAAMGARGEKDAFAGTEEGKLEWVQHKNILSRQLSAAKESTTASGICVFCYSSLFDPLSGEPNPETEKELLLFAPLLKE